MHILKFVPHLALMINRRSRRAILDHMACTHYPEGIFDDTSDEAEQELERLNNNYNAMLQLILDERILAIQKGLASFRCGACDQSIDWWKGFDVDTEDEFMELIHTMCVVEAGSPDVDDYHVTKSVHRLRQFVLSNGKRLERERGLCDQEWYSNRKRFRSQHYEDSDYAW